MGALQYVICFVSEWVRERQQSLIDFLFEENAILKEQLHEPVRLTDEERIRLARKAHVLRRQTLQQIASLAQADTIRAWYRHLVIPGTNRRTKKGGPGRPRIDERLVKLIIRFAEENPSWGYTSIRNALQGVEIQVGRSTIQRTLREHGIDPAPIRSRSGPSWRMFFKAHWEHPEVIKIFGALSWRRLSFLWTHLVDRCRRQLERCEGQSNTENSFEPAAKRTTPNSVVSFLGLSSVNVCFKCGNLHAGLHFSEEVICLQPSGPTKAANDHEVADLKSA